MLVGLQRVKLCHHPKLCTWRCLAPGQDRSLCLQHHCFSPLGYREGDEKGKGCVVLKGQKKFSSCFFLKTKARRTSEGSENPVESALKYSGCAKPSLHPVCRVTALMQHCACHYYFRPTNPRTCWCTVTAILKHKRHKAWSTSLLREHNSASHHSCQVHTEVWGFPWHPFLFGGLADTFLQLSPPSTTLQFLWRQSPDWDTQRQHFLETNSLKGVESNHKQQLHKKI